MLLKEISRREFDALVVKGLAAWFLLPPLETLGRFLPNPEKESISPELGDVVLTENGQRYLIKQELEGERLVRRRYQIPDFNFWKAVVGYQGQEKEINQAALGDIPEAPVSQETEVPHWDGTTKNHSPDGGIKFIPIGGIHTQTGDNTFSEIKKALGELGFSEADILEPSYRIDRQKPLLGLPYTDKDSSQNHQQSLENLNLLIYLWKKQFPLEKFWLLGHSHGGWLAYELARKHSDAVAGVITFDGAIKGAKVTPYPTPVESLGARAFYGESAGFLVERGADAQTSLSVEKEVKRLQENGLIFVSFASTEDYIVKPQYALVQASNKNFGGKEIELSFSMGTWPEWDVAKSAAEKFDRFKLDLDAPVAESSAQLKWGIDAHGGVLTHPKVLEYLKLIIGSQIDLQALFEGRVKIEVVSVSPPGIDYPSYISIWPDIEVVFNRAISPRQISFSSDPYFPVEILTEEEAQKTGDIIPPNEIIWVPNQQLKKDTTYRITLRFKSGREYAWSFKTPDTEAGGVKGWERNFRQQQRIYEAKYPPQEVDTLNKIISKVLDTPNKMYQGDGFWVGYSPRGEIFNVNILCDEPYEVIEKRVWNWFSQQGWDLIKVLPKPKIEWYSTCSLPPHVMLP